MAPQPYVTLGRATSDLLLEQTRISILSWNLGPGSRASSLWPTFVDAPSCSANTLWNRHRVKSTHIPTEVGHLRTSEVVSRALFRRTPGNCISYFTMMSLHCQNAVAKKRSIAWNILLAVCTVLLQEEIDMVAGDFNGASWRRVSGLGQQFDSTLEEAFKNAQLAVPPRFTPLWGAGGIPREWMTHVGLSSRPGLDRNGLFGNTGHLR